MAETSLSVNLSYRREDLALDVSFVLRLQWTVLFGSSGEGKTTLLRLISGLLTPKEGRISLGDRAFFDSTSRTNLAPSQRKAGFVTQHASLFPHLTARENVAFGLHKLNPSQRDSRVEEMLDLFEARTLAERRPEKLSGGEKQRIALARALAPRPSLLLLDEPFAALDLSARSLITGRIRETGVPVLHVSHDLADAWQMDTEALILEDGRIQAQGDARKVLTPYRDRLLAQLS
ncbi:ATP-binding cassette domain-containing protein [Silvibacterium acidisoli]|uniref:ATP-binding cassette domain-containing protein n=1 Tax=Acidobacteriaceae bacterium ZG23-2 TaxID=2883246 RepID=UPI00406C8A7A